ncbi:MAG: peptidoglycan DD-metalloendopeptidase family protein [Alphaproteobacteria bacterium]|jgi:murein DD-endopeptidase MepM/ murein hydrolase activator NlpD|nr:peptidoglycan DD-metalloendopeptidase family protein [Alphaproteobacteria bacterium]
MQRQYFGRRQSWLARILASRQLFPERQIIIRAKGEVSYLSLSRSMQAGAAVAAVVAGLWLVAGSGYMVYSAIDRQSREQRLNDLINDKDRTIGELFASYETVATELQKTRENAGGLTREMEEKVDRMRQLANQFGKLRHDFSLARNELDLVVRERDQANRLRDEYAAETAKMREETTREVARLKQDQTTTVQRLREEQTATVERMSKEHAATVERMARERDATIAALKQENAATVARLTENSAGAVARLQDENIAALSRQQAADAERLAKLARDHAAELAQMQDDHAATVELLQSQVAQSQKSQRDMLARLQERAVQSITGLEKAIKLTGIDPSDLLQQAGAQITGGQPGLNPAGGQGGPFIPLSKIKPRDTKNETVEQMAARLEAAMTRWGGLQALLARLPVAKPVENVSLSSGFGRRVDPITRQAAFHSGLDFQGSANTPIMATAPGVVTIGGRDGAYGITVEIDHGYGFKSRYSHLRQALVEEGQTISAGQRIGLMGATGRATGVHLHYEVLFNDEPLNPANFLEAGNHVLKLEEAEGPQRKAKKK